MKRPVLKRMIKTVEIITWTLEYEDIPVEELTAGSLTAGDKPTHTALPEGTPSPQPELPDPKTG
jgi:hypothetical protein